MDAYKHGFVVKSQEELEELMGPIGSDSWNNRNDEWADVFVSEMEEYIGKPYFGKPLVLVDELEAWGWYFDTRWVHELKRCTLEALIESGIPFDRVYAVCPGERISEDDVDLVSPDELEVLYVEQN